MAKDGTNRGGRRVRAGAKPDPLKGKLEAGKPVSRLLEPADLDPFGLDGVDMGEGAVLDGKLCPNLPPICPRHSVMVSRCWLGSSTGKPGPGSTHAVLHPSYPED